SGGTAPINYTWTVENETISSGTDRTLAYTNSGTALSIFVRVTAKDANFTQATSSSFKTNITLPGYWKLATYRGHRSPFLNSQSEWRVALSVTERAGL
ncbi:MAG: hypothetical protein ACJ770_09665, partial [Gemmatimonadaceae bacterium]